MYYVYILKTSRNTLYTGQTNNISRRLEEHKSRSKKSSKYMRSFKSFELVHTEIYKTLTEALKREFEIKKLTKKQKGTLIKGGLRQG